MNMKECIENCSDCHNICLETLTYCLGKGSQHVASAHIQALLDCADACRISADSMLRSSALHGRTCGLCAEACERCAKSCEAFGNDAQMKKCAEICRRCAKSCRDMAA